MFFVQNRSFVWDHFQFESTDPLTLLLTGVYWRVAFPDFDFPLKSTKTYLLIHLFPPCGKDS
jgi:hypothetical protein